MRCYGRAVMHPVDQTLPWLSRVAVEGDVEALASLDEALTTSALAASDLVAQVPEQHVRALMRVLLLERTRLLQRQCGAELALARALSEQGRRDQELAVAVEELRRSAEDLLHGQKLELVGRLVGGIAHDFNNILSVIVNYAHFIEEAAEPGPVLDDIREVSQAASRAADLTRRLLLFVRRDDLDGETVDVATELAQVERMLGRLVGEGVALRMELSEEGSTVVDLERSRLEQVVTNLVVNARDALTRGGSVVVSATTVVVQGETWVQLRVQDDGAGMDEAALSRAVEPFFSTKARTAGTGLGLATVASVVEQAGGSLQLDSSPDQGTRVTILLPPSTGSPTRRELDAPRTPGPRGTGRVVLVEDDPAVLRLAHRVLLQAGYDVVGCRNAAQARVAVDATTDVLVTDLVLPDLRGDELVAELCTDLPGLPVLLVSGYDEQPVHGIPLLRKPFTGRALLDAVAGLLVQAPV